jgi:hypothetical protein
MKKKFTLLVAAVALAGCAGNGGSFGRAMVPLGSAAGTYLVLSHPETYHYAQQPVRPPIQFSSTHANVLLHHRQHHQLPHVLREAK